MNNIRKYSRPRDLSDISRQEYQTAFRVMTAGMDITKQYQQLLDAGMPGPKILDCMEQHYDAIQKSKASDEDKQSACNSLAEWAIQSLGDAVEDWAIADWSIEPQSDDWETDHVVTQIHESTDDESDMIVLEGLMSFFSKKPTTNIYYHAPTKSFVGSVNNEPMKRPMKEGAFFNHLVSKHGFHPEHADRAIASFKAGNPTGEGAPQPVHHASMAHSNLKLAELHQDSGDLKARDKHVELFNHHMDKMEAGLHKNPKLMTHEIKHIHKSMAAIADRMGL
jgi:hypothetical protein